jgi:hypothetical protein
LQTPPHRVTVRRPIELVLDYLESAILSVRMKDMSPNGRANQICDLQPGQIGLLFEEFDRVSRHPPSVIRALAEPTKDPRKFRIFSLASTLEQKCSFAEDLSSVTEEMVHSFHTEFER